MKIFLSHASRDKALVREIRNHLPEHVRSWLDEKQLLIGDDLGGSIKKAIEADTDYVIIFLSRDSVTSKWVKRELAWALKREKQLGRPFVLPMLLDKETWSLVQPKGFRSRKYILCTDFSEQGVAHAANLLSEELFACLSREAEKQSLPESLVEMVDMPIQGQSEHMIKLGAGVLLECSTLEPKLNLPYKTDFIGQDIFFPLIDLKLKNSGNGVAYLTKLEIDVENVSVNTTPILEFYIASTDQHDMLLQVKNCGWGPARDVCIENLHDDKLRKHLKLKQKDYFWRGEIEAGKAIDILIPKSTIITVSSGPISGSPGFITYADSTGKEHAFQFRYSPYPFEEYVINLADAGFEVRHHDYARAREPSARYNVILPTEPTKYLKGFDISHEIAPQQTERFQVVAASEKSADFHLVVRVRYDRDKIVASQTVKLSVVNPNSLWYYNYLKPSWIASADESLKGHGANEFLARKLFPESGDSFKEVFLRGDEIVEPKDKQTRRPVDEDNRESTAIALKNIAWMLIDEEIDIAGGVRKAKRAVQLSPKEPYHMDTLALGLYKLGSYDEAAKYWEMAQQNGLDDAELRACLGRAREAARKQRNL
jgi:hypothetical protein